MGSFVSQKLNINLNHIHIFAGEHVRKYTYMIIGIFALLTINVVD